MSWTGTEHQRREQGTCSAPREVKRLYRVRTGSPCKVRKIMEPGAKRGPWTEFRTTHATVFDTLLHPSSFRRGCWLIFRGENNYELMVMDHYVDLPNG